MKEIKLYEHKKDCCSCGACYNICPKKAIHMKADDEGFIYPSIDDKVCISCGMCKKVCAYQNSSVKNEVIEVYAASAKEDNILLTSASGGIFAVLANQILSSKGVVFGCSLEEEDGVIVPKHRMIESKQDLIKLQGSKYVQSMIEDTYSKAKNELIAGRKVLFSGTPCQIAGLYGYLQKDYENLITIDLICHGVPGIKFFQEYIKQLERKRKLHIVDIKFRDKYAGWGYNGKLFYLYKGIMKEKKFQVNLSSYYRFFMNSDSCRENCISCKYTNKHRPGDLTIGDYWGIEKEHPEFLKSNSGLFDKNKGISCILINNQKGKECIQNNQDQLILMKSDFKKVANHNEQLKSPSKLSKEREYILELFKDKGYQAVDKYFYKKLGVKRYLYVIWNRIPKDMKSTVKKLIRK